jgi:hypothetical protein
MNRRRFLAAVAAVGAAPLVKQPAAPTTEVSSGEPLMFTVSFPTEGDGQCDEADEHGMALCVWDEDGYMHRLTPLRKRWEDL